MTDVTIVNDAYNLIKWYMIGLQSFPRSHRYGVGLRIENSLHEMFKLLLEAKFKNEKLDKLKQANIELEYLRFLGRELYELKLIDSKKHHAFIAQINNIGKQLGGWIKSLDKTK